jgi:hypothetical protein
MRQYYYILIAFPAFLAGQEQHLVKDEIGRGGGVRTIRVKREGK